MYAQPRVISPPIPQGAETVVLRRG